jgi:protoheme IX farnesyltransferase
MIADTAKTLSIAAIAAKIGQYAAFVKLRLSFLVVVSSVIGYGIGAVNFSWIEVLWLALSGFLLTGASNGFNQIIERDVDALMKRTQNRPLPTGKMTVVEGLILSTILGISGVAILIIFFNQLAAVLGGLALFSYVFVYTPLKKHSNWAVFAGAFPGAIPPMLGYVAATADFDLYAGLLFAIQFVWQFPHFWAIAWITHDDYMKAGYKLLPSSGGRDTKSAFMTLLYALFLIPMGVLPWAFDLVGAWAAIVAGIMALLFSIPAIKLYLTRSDSAARQVMFASFFYLPIVQLIYLLDKF